MIDYNSNHQYIKGNVNDRTGKRIFITGLTLILSFSGCSKTSNCIIEGDHAHFYVNEENIGRYIVSEKENVSGLKHTDKYIPIDKENEELLHFMNKRGLFKIDENKQSIKQFIYNHPDYTEYEYKDIYMDQVPMYYDGKHLEYRLVPKTRYVWSTEIKQNWTGKERTCHYVFYGFKVEKNEKGKYVYKKSEPVDDLSQLPVEYRFIKQGEFYEIEYLEKKINLNREEER